jgi:uncharacterized membrane protein YhaH (DUF805 family)
MIAPIQWFVYSIKNFKDYRGRARRLEYWYFVLCNVLISLGIGLFLRWVLGDTLTDILSSLVSLAMLIPAVTLSIRRLHDTGRSGWFLLLNFLPVLGWIVLLFFLVQPGHPSDNLWGSNPKKSGSDLPPTQAF